jgi:PAS domain S-box-containing protein
MNLTTDLNRYYLRFQSYALSRMALSTPFETDSISYLRMRILFAMIFTGLVIGLFTLAPVVVMAIRLKIWPLLIFDIAVWLLGIVLLLASRPHYEVRAAITLFMVYFVGLVIILFMGPLSGGPAWLFAFAVLVGVLLGTKAAIKALIVNALTLMVIGLVFYSDLLGGTFPFFRSIEHMIVTGANFMLLNAIAAMSVAVLVKGLMTAHEKERNATRILEKERLRLLETKNELESEVEDRKQAENALRQSEKNYRLLAENVSDVIWVSDMQLNFTYYSPSVYQLQGFTPEEAKTLTIKEIMTPASYELVMRNFKQGMAEIKAQQFDPDRFVSLVLQLYCKDGSTILTEVKANFIFDTNGRPEGIIGVTRGIGERKEIEIALRKSEEKHRKLVSNISDVIVILNEEGLVVYKSPNVTEQFGWHPDELIHQPGLLTVSPDDQERIGNELAQILHEDKAKITVEFDYLCKDGSTKPVELKAVNMINDPVINGILANYRDITERKFSEKTLKQSEEKYRTMIDRSNDMIWTLDTAGKFTFFNRQTEEVTGLKLSDWLGKSFVPLILEEDLPMIDTIFKKGLQGKSAQYKLRVRDHADEILTIQVNMAPLLKDGEVSGLVSFGRDITEKQIVEKEKANLEAQLQQAHKMESIGTLAGGIAHDFNNILFPMFGYLEMVLEDMPHDSPSRGKLNEVFQGALRARDLIQQILTFSRQTEYEKKPIKIQLVINEVLKLIRSTLPTTISIHQDICDSCESVMADPTQIHQIAMNLMTNAYHAMEEKGGTLRVSLKEVALTDADLTDSAMVPGSYACLMVADTGPGMGQGTLSRIFDPYFTTKKEGKGTGLGLSVVHGIVKSDGGHIRVHSEPGKGSEFKVYLPVHKPQETVKKMETHVDIQKGTERILLIDDQDVIVKMTSQMLERLGYHVTARTSSTDALEAFRAQPDKYDLVITDMTMPNMTGEKLAGEMMKIRSDIPVILCTGFSEGMSPERAASFGIKGFLMKPVVMKELSGAIRAALDNAL